jgi:hypothetical protein
MQCIMSLNKRQLTYTTSKTYKLAEQNNVIQRTCKFLEINSKIHWTGTPTASMHTSVQQQLNNEKIRNCWNHGSQTTFISKQLSLITPILQEVWLLYLILDIHKHHPSHLMFNILYALLVQWNIKFYLKTKETKDLCGGGNVKSN